MKVLASRIPPDILATLEYSARVFHRSLRGEKEHRKGITTNTYHLGCWRLYLPRERTTAMSKKCRGRRFLRTNVLLRRLIDKIFMENFRHHYNYYRLINQKWRTNGSATKCFKTCALNLDGFSEFHVDYRDVKNGNLSVRMVAKSIDIILLGLLHCHSIWRVYGRRSGISAIRVQDRGEKRRRYHI